ncbi:hypothetical protein BJ095_10155 [Ureibacillus chungkukjangi]|uniref:Uncharacterized protein n=1 Tax=Ureibacillus chungkukjangi TaxID=1202712 RepID=A0A318TVI1_9BACL|nr:hypothetical protein BJ095_10155 [Ureibacillus chungkukjangi]
MTNPKYAASMESIVLNPHYSQVGTLFTSLNFPRPFAGLVRQSKI